MAQIPPEFDQKADRNLSAGEPSAELIGSSGNNSSQAGGYGGYAGYGYGGYGGGAASDSELSLVHYLQVIYRRRYIAATAFLLIVVIAALQTFTATRIFEASTRILIERDNPNVVSFQEVLEQTEVTDDYYETQYAILRSRGLARRTLAALNAWDDPVFHREPDFSIRALEGADQRHPALR